MRLQKSTIWLPTLLVTFVAAGCVRTPQNLRETSHSAGSEDSSDSKGLLARSLQLDNDMLGKADQALNAFSALRAPGSAGLVWLDGSRSMFAVREGFSFSLCQYEAVTGTSDRGDGGNRVLITSADPSLATRNALRYLKALPGYERTSIGTCDVVVTPATRNNEPWLVFVIESRSTQAP